MTNCSARTCSSPSTPGTCGRCAGSPGPRQGAVAAGLRPRRAAGASVPDPYYGGPQGFTEVLTMVRAAMPGLLKYLTSSAVNGGIAQRRLMRASRGGSCFDARLPRAGRGLTPAPQASSISASPAAILRPSASRLRAALRSRSCSTPHTGQVHDLTDERLWPVAVPTGRAQLRRREQPVHLDYGPPVVGGLLLDQPDQRGPARIVDRPGQSRPRQTSDGQVLQVDRLVIADQPESELVVMVEAGLPDLSVQLGDPADGLRRSAPPRCLRQSARCARPNRRCAERRWRGLSMISPSEVTASRSRPRDPHPPPR